MQAGYSETYLYRIDADDVIRYVDSSWMKFARDNDAAHLSQGAILNTSIWDYIEGEAAKYLYRDVFAKLRRSNAELIIPFRCDSPTVIRHMQLVLRSGSDKSIVMEGCLLEKKHREAVSLFDIKADRTDETIEICSICRKLHVRTDEWLEVDYAIVQKRLFKKAHLPRLDEKICPACEKLITKSLNDSLKR